MLTSHAASSDSSRHRPKQRMTLSQRLTRAGLTFILLGTVASILPMQNGVAFAAPNGCGTGTPGRYAIWPGTVPPPPLSGALPDNFPVTYVATTFYFYYSPLPTTAPYNPVTPVISNITVTSGVLMINGVLVSSTDPPVMNSMSSEDISGNADSVQGNPGKASFKSSYTDSMGNTYTALVFVHYP